MYYLKDVSAYQELFKSFDIFSFRQLFFPAVAQPAHRCEWSKINICRRIAMQFFKLDMDFNETQYQEIVERTAII